MYISSIQTHTTKKKSSNIDFFNHYVNLFITKHYVKYKIIKQVQLEIMTLAKY